jgi:hypothetical protein
MSNLAIQMQIFYSKTKESYLSIIMRNHGTPNIMEEKEWQNVQNVQPKSQSRRRLGKWLDAQTNRAKECNLKSGYMNAQNATPPSAKC